MRTLIIVRLFLLVPAVWFAYELYMNKSASGSVSNIFSSGATLLGALFACQEYTKWNKHRKPGITSTTAPSRKVSQHDVDLFGEFQKTLPDKPTIRILREADFKADYRARDIEPLNLFADEWGDSNRKFLDPILEAKRKNLHDAACEMVWLFSKETIPNDDKTGWRTVCPREYRGEEWPEHVQESAEALNQSSRRFVSIYNEFVHIARTKLNPVS